MRNKEDNWKIIEVENISFKLYRSTLEEIFTA